MWHDFYPPPSLGLFRFPAITFFIFITTMFEPTSVFLFFQLFFTLNAALFLLLLATFLFTSFRNRRAASRLDTATCRLPLSRLAAIAADDFDRSLAGYEQQHIQAEIIRKMGALPASTITSTTESSAKDHHHHHHHHPHNQEPLTMVVVSEDFLKRDFDLL